MKNNVNKFESTHQKNNNGNDNADLTLAHTRKMNTYVQIASKIRNNDKLTTSEIESMYVKLKNKWLQEIEPDKYYNVAIENFELNGVDFTCQHIFYDNVTKCVSEVAILQRYIEKQKDDLNDIYYEYSITLNRLYDIIYNMAHAVRCYHRVQQVNSEQLYTINNEMGLFRFRPINPDTLSSYQHLLMYLLNTLEYHNYRRYGSDCYKPIFTKEGYYTFSWESVMSIKDFVYQTCDKELNADQWCNLTSSSGNIYHAVEYLTNCHDRQFLKLEKNRKVFSFKNGIYVLAVLNEENVPEDKFYPYSTSDLKLPFDTTQIACNYFDFDFNNYDGVPWYSISTPNVQKILDYQYQDEKDYTSICQWMYVLLGRLFYDLHEFDHWQVLPFIKGLAGTGKSSIAEYFIQKIYDCSDVGIISNNAQEVFGLETLQNKFVFIAAEVKENFKLDQAVIQNMISGESISINIKGKPSVSVKWITPGIMSGNNYPNWCNNSGSMSRRIICFNYKKKVINVDPEIKDTMYSEIPILIKKCNSAYLEAVHKYGKKDIWKQLPEYFKETTRNLAQETNAIQSFLASDNIEYGPDKYHKLVDFKHRLKEFCHENGFRFNKFTNDSCITPFQDASETYNTPITIKKTRKNWPPDSNVRTNSTYIIGLHVMSELQCGVWDGNGEDE